MIFGGDECGVTRRIQFPTLDRGPRPALLLLTPMSVMTSLAFERGEKQVNLQPDHTSHASRIGCCLLQATEGVYEVARQLFRGRNVRGSVR